MDLASDTFADSNLLLPPSAYEGQLFRALFGGDMPQPQMKMPPGSVDELGYTYDALHVSPDGRIEGGLYSPEYYVYSPHTGSWEDGMLAIEDFDWSRTTEPAEIGGAQGDEVQDRIGLLATERYESHVPSPEESLRDAENPAVDLEQKPSPTKTYSEHLAQATNTSAEFTPRTPLSEAKQEDASHTVSVSSPWIPSPPREGLSTSTSVSSPTSLELHPQSAEGKNQHGNDTNSVHVDIARTVIETHNLTTVFEGIRTPDIRLHENENTCFYTEGLQKDVPTVGKVSHESGKHNGNDPMGSSELESKSLSLSPKAPLQTASGWYGLMSQEGSQPIATPPQPPMQRLPDTERSHEAFMASGALGAYQNTYYPIGELSCYSEQAPLPASVQNGTDDELKHHESFHMYSIAHGTQLRQDSVTQLPVHSVPLEEKDDDAPQTVAAAAVSIKSSKEVPTGSQTMEKISTPAGESIDEQWQAQLEDAAGEASSDDFSELVSTGYKDCNVGTNQTSPVNKVEEASPEASSLWPDTLLEHHLGSNEKLPISPTQADTEAPGEQCVEVAVTQANADGDIMVEPSHADMPSQSLHIESSVSTEATTDDQDSDVAAISDREITSKQNEETPPMSPVTNNAGVAIESIQIAPTLSTPATKDANPRKRPSPAREEKDTEVETPARKKSKKVTPARPRVAEDLELSTTPQEEESNTEIPIAKTKRSKSRSVEEDTRVLQKTQPKQEGTTSPLARFAYGKYSRPLQELFALKPTSNPIFGSEVGLQQPGNDGVDMEEHYSDIDVPLPPATPAPAAVTTPNTTKSRSRVSTYELSSLHDNTPRDRSKRKRAVTEEVCTIPGPHFALHRNPSHKSSPASQKADEISVPVVSAITGNSFNLIEEDTPTAEQDGLEESSTPVPKAKVKPVTTRKMPAPCAYIAQPKSVREKKATAIDVQEDDEPELFPAAMIETEQPTSTITIPAPPKLTSTKAKRTTKGATDGQVLQSVERKHPFDVGYGKRHTRGDTRFEAQSVSNSAAASETSYKNVTKDEDYDDDDADGDWSDAAIAIAKARTKANSTLLSLHPSTSRDATPTPSTVSLSSAAKVNRYGFKTLAKQTPRTRKAATPAVSKPKAKEKAKADAVPDKRQTRRASALEEDLRKAKDANVKLRLRSRGTEGS